MKNLCKINQFSYLNYSVPIIIITMITSPQFGRLLFPGNSDESAPWQWGSDAPTDPGDPGTLCSPGTTDPDRSPASLGAILLHGFPPRGPAPPRSRPGRSSSHTRHRSSTGITLPTDQCVQHWQPIFLNLNLKNNR